MNENTHFLLWHIFLLLIYSSNTYLRLHGTSGHFRVLHCVIFLLPLFCGHEMCRTFAGLPSPPAHLHSGMQARISHIKQCAESSTFLTEIGEKHLNSFFLLKLTLWQRILISSYYITIGYLFPIGNISLNHSHTFFF